MKSDVIEVSSREDRTGLVLELAERTAVYQKLSHKSALHLRLLAEEMMSMMRAIVGDVKGRFWIESEDGQYELHLRAETDVDWLERERLLSASSSGRNEAERGFMGKLRAFFEPAEGLPVLFDLCPDGIYSDMTWSMRSYEEQILWQTRYWLTSALSKKKDNRALEQLDYFKDNGVAYNFLKGFYYRNIGERSMAMECYEKVLKLNPKHQRSKREKVNILLSLGKYSEAYELAKENYEYDKTNIYHIHSYFISLVRRKEYLTISDIGILDDLIRDMESRIDRKAEDMSRCMKGEYAYYVKNDLDRARVILLEAIQLNENKNYPKKSLKEIYKSAKKIHEFSQLGLTDVNECYEMDDFE